MHDTPRPTPDGFAAASADETRIAAPPVGSVVHASSYAAATHGPPLAVPNASHTKAFAPAAACLASAGPSTTAKMLPEVALPSAANSPAEAIAAAAAAAAASAAGLLPRVPAPIPVPALEMRAGAESVLSTRLSSSASAFPPSSVTWASHPLQLRKGPEAANNMEAAATVATSVASAAYAGRSALPPGTRAAAPGAGARAVPVPLPAPTPPTSTPASAAPSAYRSSAITVEALPPVTADTRLFTQVVGVADAPVRTERLQLLWSLLVGAAAGDGNGSSVVKDKEGGDRALTSITKNLPDEGPRSVDAARQLLSSPLSPLEARLMRRQLDTVDAVRC